MSVARATAVLLRVTVISLASVALAPLTQARADPPSGPPTLEITTPRNGATINSSAPVFVGTTNFFLEEALEEEGLEEVPPVILRLYAGTAAQGEPVQKIPAPVGPFGAWSAAPAALPAGTYTARAEQSDEAEESEEPEEPEEPGLSEPVTFTIDTSPPEVSLTSPADGSSSSGESVGVGGAAGTASGDLPAITVQLSQAGADGAPPLETLVVQASQGGWSGAFGGLAPGSYTAQASQRDEAGNTGMSQSISFAVVTPAAPPGPAASFSWVPSAPVVGESVSLVSNSTDSSSPITGFAWSLSPNVPFVAGKPVLTTSFSTAGAHVVRLRISDAAGRSSVATETVPVGAHPTILMQPFPVVRIAGSITGRGARIKLLTVQAPIAARVTIRCHGGGCRTRSESRSAKASSTGNRKAAAVLLSFKHFERNYRAGARLEVFVVKPGQVGKYTVFRIRRHKLPIREDACIVAAGAKPIACASS